MDDYHLEPSTSATDVPAPPPPEHRMRSASISFPIPIASRPSSTLPPSEEPLSSSIDGFRKQIGTPVFLRQDVPRVEGLERATPPSSSVPFRYFLVACYVKFDNRSQRLRVLTSEGRML
jgi:hypothetical protein